MKLLVFGKGKTGRGGNGSYFLKLLTLSTFFTSSFSFISCLNGLTFFLFLCLLLSNTITCDHAFWTRLHSPSYSYGKSKCQFNQNSLTYYRHSNGWGQRFYYRSKPKKKNTYPIAVLTWKMAVGKCNKSNLYKHHKYTNHVAKLHCIFLIFNIICNSYGFNPPRIFTAVVCNVFIIVKQSMFLITINKLMVEVINSWHTMINCLIRIKENQRIRNDINRDWS